MTNIVLRGCNGKMGEVITQMVEEDETATIVAGVDVSTEEKYDYPVYSSFSQCTEKPDVIIDFSSPVGIDEMFEYAKANGVGIVLCTTGFTSEDDKLIEETSNVIPILRSANMSLGINLLLKLVKEAAKILTEAGFDIEIVDKHHNKKVDAPSGTALALADAMNETLDKEYTYKYDRWKLREPREKKEIGISAIRGGNIVGEHDVIFAGTDEVVEISHTAYSKAIFAKGAIQAAKHLQDKPPGMYQMSDVIG